MPSTTAITLLMDNLAIVPSMTAEHGLSIWIEIDRKRILWDTGQTDRVFENARLLGIDVSTADAIALSHGHNDHTGGLAKAIALCLNATVYLHPSATQAKYSLKTGQSRPIGMDRQAQLAIIEKDIAGGVVFTDRKTAIADGVMLTGPVPRRTSYEDTGGRFFTDSAGKNTDELADDQSLYFECSKGIVVILGCAHSGVVNILDTIAEWTNHSRIHAVIGGMHLVNADAARIEQTIAAFKRYDIQVIAPLHCTGSAAMQRLEEIFDNRYLSLGAGSQLSF